MRWAIIWSFTASLTYLCVRGVDLAGRIAIGVCLFALLPFLVICLIGMVRIDVARCWSWTSAAGQVSHTQGERASELGRSCRAAVGSRRWCVCRLSSGAEGLAPGLNQRRVGWCRCLAAGGCSGPT